jgi:hypothetical protein
MGQPHQQAAVAAGTAQQNKSADMQSSKHVCVGWAAAEACGSQISRRR